jgi:hypothetical protein
VALYPVVGYGPLEGDHFSPGTWKTSGHVWTGRVLVPTYN